MPRATGTLDCVALCGGIVPEVMGFSEDPTSFALAISRLTSVTGFLDLERSVWQASDRHRRRRSYDAYHFVGDSFDYKSGLFVAVQSWLPVSAWLTTRCDTLNDFCMEVQEWLLGCIGVQGQTMAGQGKLITHTLAQNSSLNPYAPQTQVE
jgi:hypothetical protein